MGLFGIFSSSTKTKSYYAERIAQEQRNLAQLKITLEAMKGNRSTTSQIAAQKMKIEQQKGFINTLKAEMKVAPKG